MSINGELTRTDDDAFTGWIASLTFDVDVTLTANPHKAKETHPNYQITTRTPRGRDIRIGSAWNATSRQGNAYLSLAISINGADVRVNAIADKDTGAYRLIEWAA